MTPDAPPSTNSFGFYKRQQAAISRRILYPLTAFYTAYSVILLVLALRTAHPYLASAFFLAGVPVWTIVEYLFHRFILHGRFKRSKKFYKKFYTGLANKYLDPLHWEHHERPTDGLHISGELKDLIPLFAVAAPLSFIFPLYTTPVLLAGTIQSYVAEEWIHHCIHFYNFRNRYFRHIKGYHLYHHSSHGIRTGYGITSGFWDIIFATRFPAQIRQRLSGRGRTPGLSVSGRTEATH
jgi:4-hydroxysphinganine ceramide fatty acyl 2-hydroxylase